MFIKDAALYYIKKPLTGEVVVKLDWSFIS